MARNIRLFSKHADSRIHTVITWIIAVALGSAPLLFYPAASDPFEFTKLAVVGILVGIGLCMWMVDAIVKRRLELVWTAVHWCVAGLVLAFTVSTAFSVSYYRSFIGPVGATSTTSTAVLVCAILFFLIVQVVTTKKRLTLVGTAAGAGVALAALVMCFQFLGVYLFPWVGTHVASFHTLGFSSFTAALALGTAAVFLIGMSFAARSAMLRIVCLSGAGIFFVIEALMDKKVGWIGIGVALIALVAFFAVRARQIPSWWVVVPTGFLCVAVVLIMLPVSSWVKLDIPSDTVLEQSTSWSIAGAALRQRPLTGTGPQTFLDAFQEFRPSSFSNTEQWQLRFIKSGNQWSEMATTTGILGVGMFAAMIGAFCFLMLRFIIHASPSSFEWKMTVTVLSAWIVLTFSSFILPWNFFTALLWWALIALGVRIIVPSLTRDIHEITPKKHSAGFAVASILMTIFVVVTATGIFFSVRVWGGERLQAKVRSTQIQDIAGLTAARQSIVRAHAWNPYSADIEMTAGQAYALEAAAKMAGSREEAQQLAVISAEYVGKAIARDPDNAQMYEQGAIVYRTMENVMDLAEAEREIARLYEEAVERDLLNPLLRTSLGNAYIALAKGEKSSSGADAAAVYFEKAFATLDDAQALKPNLLDPQLSIAFAEELAGRAKESEDRLLALFEAYPSLPDVGMALGDLYQRQKQYDRAEEVYADVIARNPQTLIAYWQLGQIYEEQERYEESLNVFQTLQSLQPDNADVQQKITEVSAQMSPAILP